ncbi:MAG: hypothetical protein JEZ03_16195 [Bacteroidales bacterium]|nr:hypothetical protein [Bacteroidales bacterium]
MNNFKLNKTKVYVSLKLKPLFFLCLILNLSSALAQQPEDRNDSLVLNQDQQIESTAKIEVPEFIDPNAHSPRKATIYSAVVPGLGQAYNKKYYKLPIVYAGIGGLGYLIYYNRLEYHKFRDAYNFVRSGNTGEPINDYVDLFKSDASALQSRRNEFRKEMEKYSIYLALFYIVQIVDATVDAHLMDYDVSDDLSLSLQPNLIPITTSQQTPGIGGGLSLKLKF